MKHRLSLLILSLLLFTGCITEDVATDTRRGNFETLWQLFDERYCFFDYKAEEYGLDWRKVYEDYAVRVDEQMTEEQLFEVLSELCSELRDGHVNLVTPYGTSRYGAWFDDYPANYSDTLERCYLGRTEEYRSSGALKYKILPDNVGYVRCSSFENNFGDGTLHEMMRYLALCNGLILDIRNNGGGMLTAAEKLASLFVNEKTLAGYIMHKTGPAHAAFSAPEPLYVEPFEGLRWQKPVVVLVNRRTYSAANSFTMYLKGMPHVTILGDYTGGGSGMPLMSELPNGWSVRFSACPMLDRYGNHTELGIAPDVEADITSEDFQRSIDTLIETARTMLKQ
ncbi:MAG: S41 family peptidase [Bacteroidaceae bacterium]|nr:S41 family peptidase [Bacteroidaceae bacterium]